MRAHWMLAEIGLEYETRAIQSRSGETHEETFKQLNPRHKIPVLQHNSFVITESAAIVQYLSEALADPKAFHVPHDAESRAKLNEWSYFIMTELDAGSLYVVRRHEDLSQIYGRAPIAAGAARTYFSHNLAAMTNRIADEPYLMGERISTADILLTTCLDWAAFIGVQLPLELNDYRLRLSQRPAYQAAMKKNLPSGSN